MKLFVIMFLWTGHLVYANKNNNLEAQQYKNKVHKIYIYKTSSENQGKTNTYPNKTTKKKQKISLKKIPQLKVDPHIKHKPKKTRKDSRSR